MSPGTGINIFNSFFYTNLLQHYKDDDQADALNDINQIIALQYNRDGHQVDPAFLRQTNADKGNLCITSGNLIFLILRENIKHTSFLIDFGYQ